MSKGHAFPTVVPTTGIQHVEPGMSLRDWFAGQAMGQITEILAPVCAETGMGDLESFEFCARKSYQMADAMLAAREGKP